MVKINYVLKNKDGNLIDQSEEGHPLEVMFGVGQMIPGFEKEIAGLEVGAKKSFVVPAKDGYGEYDNDLVDTVPRERFDATMPIEVGNRFQASTSTGPMDFRVTKVEGDQITVDGNHELAGVDLYFDVEIADVRNPTEEEIEPLIRPSGGCGGGCGGCGGGCGSCGDDDCGDDDCGGSCGCGGCGE